ncbi:probable E3 ubiquitin-protein ligase RHA4A [Cicer arietinum]|uniref:Probable E3 ubiquitin-protein ligase RHA4A n=1 Tax=Cicer arietinum TaxID=3827 RepID=A0A1S2YPV0_CICAR|nr:probable E3 ubiquitin-protein ligase RHA4A [Cicer arietinum]
MNFPLHLLTPSYFLNYSSMGFYTEESISGFTISQAIYEAALIIAVLRWVLCLVFKVIKHRRTTSIHTPQQHPTCHMLPLTSFGDIKDRLPETEETCAVCLNKLKMEDDVRELMNCYHVFHMECIDKWLEHGHENENHNQTCPLCRAPLFLDSCSISSEFSSCVSPPQPSWAVERILYLFGDDLLPC